MKTHYPGGQPGLAGRAGILRQEVIGRCSVTFFRRITLSGFRALCLPQGTGGVQFRFEMVRKDGARIDVSFTARRVRRPGPVCPDPLHIRGCDGRKQAEEALRVTEERLR